MNQRGTHFQLGTTSQTYQSVYHKDYNPKEADYHSVAVTNPFRGSSLGNNEKGSFATTNKVLLRAWDHAEVARLDDKKLHQLKSHHFKLGSYHPSEAVTTNKQFHNPKSITGDASRNQEESKNKMRGHNHDFKEQSHTNYRSAYAHQFTPKDPQTTGPLNHGQSENAICFGTQALPMITTSHGSYTPKEAQRVKANPEPALGVNLGQAKDSMQTINQLYFDRKEMTKAALPESTMKELRSTHFGMGQAPLSYNTQNNNYRRAPGQSQDSKLNFKMPVYESGTWVNKEAKFQGLTTYHRQLPQRDVKPFQKATQIAKKGLELGGHSGMFQSEFKSRFGAPVNPVANQVEVSKKSNVVIGGNEKFYTTEHKGSYRPNNLKEARVDVDIKKLNTEDHFHIGGSMIQAKVTVTQDEYRPDVDRRNKVFHKANQ